MSENLFTAVLTFSLLAGGSAVIGSEMFNTRDADQAPATRVVMLPKVTITGHREAQATQVVMLPMVTVTGHREAPVRVAMAGSQTAANVQ